MKWRDGGREAGLGHNSIVESTDETYFEKDTCLNFMFQKDFQYRCKELPANLCAAKNSY